MSVKDGIAGDLSKAAIAIKRTQRRLPRALLTQPQLFHREDPQPIHRAFSTIAACATTVDKLLNIIIIFL